MRKKIIALFTAMTLAFSMITVSPAATTVSAASVEDKEFACVCEPAPASDTDNMVKYGAQNVDILTAEQAAAANLPAGYTGNVVKVSGSYTSPGLGLMLDFSGEKIKQSDIKSITFRVLVQGTKSNNYPELRIQRPGVAGNLSLQKSIANDINTWTEVTIGSDGTNFHDGTMADLCKNGYLNKFNLFVRFEHLNEFYIDSVRVELNESAKEDDGIDDFDAECMAAQAESGDKPLVTYGSKNVEKLTYDQAVAANVPSGFSKNVVKVSGAYNGAGIGTLLDFSGKKIPQNVVKSITFRVYVGYESSGNYPEFRIHRPGYTNGDFITKTSIADNVKKWTEVTIDIDKNNIYGNASILDMCKDGYLNKCNLLIRLNNIEEFYIDSIRVGLKDNDKVGPVITCDDTLYFSEEEMPEVKAHDEMEDRDVDVEYVWPEDVVLGENKLPEAGEYTIKVTAKDYYGNVSEKTVTAIVVGKDRVKPEITVTSEEIYAVTGTYPLLSATATDDSGAAPTITYSWSEGALDAAGRLTKGEHTWTIKAKDGSNNVATKEVKVYVTDEENLGTNVIDEGAMYGNDADIENVHKHSMKYVAAKSATCTSAGNIAYYYCSECGKYFADKAGSKEISKASTVVKAKGHKAVKVKGKAATFTANGLTDGSKCSVCGKVIVAQKKINKLAKPAKTKFTKVAAGKKKVSVKFKKVKNISGYQLQIARNKSMKKGLKTYKIKSSKTNYTIKKLKSKTTYYVRIRTYKKVNSSTGYSSWTKATKVKVK